MFYTHLHKDNESPVFIHSFKNYFLRPTVYLLGTENIPRIKADEAQALWTSQQTITTAAFNVYHWEFEINLVSQHNIYIFYHYRKNYSIKKIITFQLDYHMVSFVL